MSLLKWKHAESGLVRDGTWSCGSKAYDFPSMHHSLLHPCANAGGGCCGNSTYAPFLLRYESFFHSRQALLVLAFEVSVNQFHVLFVEGLPQSAHGPLQEWA